MSLLKSVYKACDCCLASTLLLVQSYETSSHTVSCSVERPHSRELIAAANQLLQKPESCQQVSELGIRSSPSSPLNSADILWDCRLSWHCGDPEQGNSLKPCLDSWATQLWSNTCSSFKSLHFGLIYYIATDNQYKCCTLRSTIVEVLLYIYWMKKLTLT